MRPNAEHAITAAGGRAADDDASRGAQTSSMAPLSTSSVKVSWLTNQKRKICLSCSVKYSQVLPPQLSGDRNRGRLYEQLVWSP